MAESLGAWTADSVISCSNSDSRLFRGPQKQLVNVLILRLGARDVPASWGPAGISENTIGHKGSYSDYTCMVTYTSLFKLGDIIVI
jgi:hypothetical protein